MSAPIADTERPSRHTRGMALEQNFTDMDHTMTDEDRLMEDTPAPNSLQWAQSRAVPVINVELAKLPDLPTGDVRDAYIWHRSKE